jgi:hypothetical protein
MWNYIVGKKYWIPIIRRGVGLPQITYGSAISIVPASLAEKHHGNRLR